jgi:uncharacterized protein YdaU (DUF1376 family)
VNFYKMFPGDYLRDTGALSITEHGAYALMMHYAYSTEKPLPVDRDLYRLLRANSKAERDAVDAVAERYWRKTEAGLVNDRISEEVSNYQAVVEKNREVGKLGGRPKKTEPVNAWVSGDDPNGSPKKAESVCAAVSEENPSQSQSKPNSSTDVELVGDGVANKASSVPIPDCQHQAILDLYAKHLPLLPQPVVWEGQRRQNLRTRWRWVLTAKNQDGKPKATTADEALDFFDRFFAYVAKSDFLTGRNGRWTACDLGWLVKAENFAKVLQGNYENKEAA